MANIITASRIVLSVLLLFQRTFSLPFNVMYLLAGITDMVDGTVARKTNTTSKLGSELDTVADAVFVISATVKILPEISLPRWTIIWIFVIMAIKIMSIVVEYITRKRFVAEHTILNKVTGIVLFAFPILMNCVDNAIAIPAMCTMAFAASLQELILVARGIGV